MIRRLLNWILRRNPGSVMGIALFLFLVIIGMAIAGQYGGQMTQVTTPDGSITTSKIADGAITTNKLASAATTTPKMSGLGVANGLATLNASGMVVQDLSYYVDLTTDVTGSLPGNNIETTPAFSAYRTSNIVVSSGTPTKINFDNEEFDTHSDFNTSTSQFTPTISGKYTISGTVCSYASTTLTKISVQLYKNGALFKTLGTWYGTSAAGNAVCEPGSVIASANGTDYFELYAIIEGSGTLTIWGTSSLTFFCGARL